MFVTLGLMIVILLIDVIAAWNSWLDEVGPDITEDTTIALSGDGCFWRGSVVQLSDCIEDGWIQ